MTKEQSTQPDDENYTTKSQIKREAEALKQLGKKIYALPKNKRGKLPLNNSLLAALEEADRIKDANALRRHFQYVGKLLRETDSEAIRTAITALETSPLAHQRLETRLEKTIEALLEGGRDVSEKLLLDHPNINRQTLNQLIRNALRALQQNGSDANDEGASLTSKAARKKLKSYLKQELTDSN